MELWDTLYHSNKPSFGTFWTLKILNLHLQLTTMALTRGPSPLTNDVSCTWPLMQLGVNFCYTEHKCGKRALTFDLYPGGDIACEVPDLGLLPELAGDIGLGLGLWGCRYSLLGCRYSL